MRILNLLQPASDDERDTQKVYYNSNGKHGNKNNVCSRFLSTCRKPAKEVWLDILTHDNNGNYTHVFVEFNANSEQE